MNITSSPLVPRCIVLSVVPIRQIRQNRFERLKKFDSEINHNELRAGTTNSGALASKVNLARVTT